MLPGNKLAEIPWIETVLSAIAGQSLKVCQRV